MFTPCFGLKSVLTFHSSWNPTPFVYHRQTFTCTNHEICTQMCCDCICKIMQKNVGFLSHHLISSKSHTSVWQRPVRQPSLLIGCIEQTLQCLRTWLGVKNDSHSLSEMILLHLSNYATESVGQSCIFQLYAWAGSFARSLAPCAATQSGRLFLLTSDCCRLFLARFRTSNGCCFVYVYTCAPSRGS